MKNIEFRIVGDRGPGLLQNNPASIAPAQQGLGARAPKTIPTPEEEAAAKVYRLPSGQIYVPSIWFVNSMKFAMKGAKIGKSAARAVFSSAVFEHPEFLECPLYHPETREPITAYTIDTRRAVIQSGMKRNSVLRSRPCIPVWSCNVTLWFDERILSIDHICGAMHEAEHWGIGDNRPSNPGGNGGPFGRFLSEVILSEEFGLNGKVEETAPKVLTATR